MERITYKKAGVDIKKAEAFVKKIRLDKVSKIRAFGSLFPLGSFLGKYKSPYLVASADGVGTKLKIAQALNIHHTIGIDLVAMNVNDLVSLGAKPLFFLDYIACGKLKAETLSELISGIKKGLKNSDCLLLGGETAEMPGMYKKNEYDLAGFSVGIVDKDKIIDGRNIKEGDVVIGLESSGVHSNGFSLVRKVLTNQQIKQYGKELLKPTRIYVKVILNLLFTIHLFTIKGIAHITGGAFYNKATKILPPDLGMVIDKKSWRVPKIFRIIQEKGRIPEEEMYSVFNMGIGMILVVKSKYAQEIRANLSRKGKAYIIGEIIKSDRKMQVL